MTLIIKNSICFCLASLITIGASWQVFKSTDGQFSVLTPGEFIQDVQTIETDIGSIDYLTYVHKAGIDPSNQTIYAVSYCDYPEHSIHSDSTDFLVEFFDSTIAQSAPASGDLLYQDVAEINGFPGRIWKIKYGEGRTIKSKAYLVDNRFYLLQVFASNEGLDTDPSGKFLNSFRLLGK